MHKLSLHQSSTLGSCMCYTLAENEQLVKERPKASIKLLNWPSLLFVVQEPPQIFLEFFQNTDPLRQLRRPKILSLS